jgi:predicted PurR-regulated permease PerM
LALKSKSAIEKKYHKNLIKMTLKLILILTLAFPALLAVKSPIYEEAIDTISRFNQLTLQDAIKSAQERVEVFFSDLGNPEVKDAIKTLQNYLHEQGLNLGKEINELYIKYKDNLNEIIKNSELNLNEKAAEMKKLSNNIFAKLQEILKTFENMIQNHQQQQIARLDDQSGSGRSFLNLIGLGDSLREMLQVSGEQLNAMNKMFQSVFRFSNAEEVSQFIEEIFQQLSSFIASILSYFSF